MLDLAITLDWLEAAVRWVHVITAITWIGTSFYFIMLDLGLRRAPDLPAGVSGEEWQVHGGGFYHVEKYSVAPARLPEHLTWFKWESYATWLSGFAMLVLVYYLGADLYLVDPAVLDMAVWQAVLLSLVSLGFGWLAYDALCRSRLGAHSTGLMLLLYLLLVAMAWGYVQVFTGRAALLHLGAFTATIMSANVFLVIIPNQKVVVADLKAGRVPDPRYGIIAKQRSTHNNYLTLPVLFLMLSTHYPLVFATRYNWLIAALVFLMGVTIRHYFNTLHARRGNPWWTWVATAALFLAAMWLSVAPGAAPAEAEEEARLSPRARALAAAPGFEAVADIVLGRCSMCHAAEPGWQGIALPPKGVMLDTPARIAGHARQIYLQAGLSHAMPPANVTAIEPAERAQIVAWYRGAGG
jgi:uncharacterized membrane protein